jgi:serine/threonine-protein kinase
MTKASRALSLVGRILAGKYRVEKVLGTGGMGVVVAATHLDLQKRRALKLMHAEHATNARAVERFLREARAAVRLESKHVARVFDVGRLDSGAPYIVMEYLEGSDLGAISKARGQLPVGEAALYVAQAASAIADAHAAGIVHRDLKPSNLFLTTLRDGSPCIKVLDFGISKVAPGEGGDALDITQTRELLGSPLYMAPEQMRANQPVDGRVDIWGLGVILYKLVTGRLPFYAHGLIEICSVVLERPPTPPSVLRPDLPPELDALILRCLAKEPAARLASAAELAEALVPFVEMRTSVERISIELIEEPAPPASVAACSMPFEGEERRSSGVPIEIVDEPEKSGSRVVTQPPPPAPRAAPRPRRGAVARAASVVLGLVGSALVVSGSGIAVSRDQAVTKSALRATAVGWSGGGAEAPIRARAVVPATCPVEQKAPPRAAPGGPEDPFRILGEPRTRY